MVHYEDGQRGCDRYSVPEKLGYWELHQSDQ